MEQRVIPPWYRLPRESDDAYSAFCRYLNMGSERSLDNFTTAIGEMQVSVERLASWAEYLLVDETGCTVRTVCSRRVNQQLRRSIGQLHAQTKNEAAHEHEANRKKPKD